MNKYQVVVPAGIRPVAEEMLRSACAVKKWDGNEVMPRETLYEWLQDAEGLFLTGHGTKVDTELLGRAPRLRVIAQASAGYENVDLDACRLRKVSFSNAPGVVVESTADVAFGIMLSAARRIHEGWNWVLSGKWEQGDMPFGVALFGKTLGIVGMGQIGAAVARRAQASGMKVVYHNRNRRPDEAALGVSYLGFDELLATADFIVVLVPMSPENVNMFGPVQFARMKPTAFFVNAARGALVDTDALCDALRTGKIASTALDVIDIEPLPASHPLLRLPNVLVTPHIGTANPETRDAMACLAAENLLAGLAGKPLITGVC